MRTLTVKARRIYLYTAAGVAAGFIASCAQTPAARKPLTTPTGQAPSNAGIEDLVRAALAEERHPIAAAIQAPVPAGVEPILGQPIDEKDERARLTLEELLPKLAGPPIEVSTAQATDDAKAIALRRYVEGRQKLLSGDAAAAIEALRAATESDPASGEPWRELGEAQRLAGQRSDAVRSFRAALGAGLNDPRVLEFLGREALERGDFEQSSQLLSRAMLADLNKSDPALSRIVPVELSRALVPTGHILAATQALRRSLTNSAPLTSTTRYGAELGAIFRRQGDLWRDVGDGMCRLGRYSEALEAYIQAEQLPSLERTPVRPRIVFALMKLGRPSSAAAAVLEDIAGRQGRAAESDLTLLRHIADHGGNAKRIASAFGAVRGPGELTPSIERDLSLAQCSLLSGDAARRALREHLVRFPTDITSAVRLFDSLDSTDAAIREAVTLASKDLSAAKLSAEALLRSRHDITEIQLASMSLVNDASLIPAYLAAKQGRPGEGLRLSNTATSAAAPAARVELALDAGMPEQVATDIQTLRAATSPEATRLLARCLLVSQQFKEALSTIQPLLDPPAASVPVRIDDLVLAGDLASRMKQSADAERWLTAANQLDPYDDRPYSLLMVFHSAGGPSPDPVKLARIVRDMRQNCPESRTVRMVRAREAMRRAQWDVAERDLRKLVDEDPGEAGPVELLAVTWQDRLKTNPAAAADARSWLQGHLRRRPQSPLLLAAWTTLEIAVGRSAEAEAPLRDAMAAGASPDVSRVLERLLRDVLSRGSEADALAAARLSGRSRTIDESIELAGIHVRAREFARALSTLRADFRPDLDLSPEQALQIIATAGQCIQRDAGPAAEPVMCDAAALFTRCVPVIDRFPVQAHQRRLEAMTVCRTVTAAELIAAAKLATDQYPQLQAGAYRVIIQNLFEAGRVQVVPDFFAASPDTVKSDIQLIGTWVDSVIRHGAASDATKLIETLHQAGSLSSLISQNDELVKEPRAEAAYMLGIGFAALNRNADSEAMYEFALTFDPDHAWSCNNLGYSLADRGVELDRAAELLERAFKVKDNEPAIIDSLGWLRYKQGIILDVIDADTGLIKTRGALSLLETAAVTNQGRMDNTIQDHLGDALWLAGQADEAILAWKRAAQLSTQTLEIIRANARPAADGDGPVAPPTDTAEVVECRKLIESTTAKRDAAAAGRPVRVAPQIAEPDPQPIKAPPKPKPNATPTPKPDANR